MMLLTGHSGIDLNASVNELPCFRKLRIELTENVTFQALRDYFRIAPHTPGTVRRLSNANNSGQLRAWDLN
jgi:hypothetical protein